MDLSSCRRDIKYSYRDEVVNFLVANYQADKWLDLDSFNTTKIKNIFCLLDLEQGIFSSKVFGEEWAIHGANFYPLNTLAVNALSLCKASNQASFIDIGSGWGHVTWKALLAGCKVHALDVGFKEKIFQEGFNDAIKTIVPKDIYQNNLVIVNSSVEDVITKNPEFYEKFDIIYSSKVLHFQAPKNFNNFAKIIYDLAKPSAKVFITADSVSNLLAIKGCSKIYKNNKANQDDIAPGYVYFDIDTQKCSDGPREAIKIWDEIPTVNINGDDHPILKGFFDTNSLRVIFETAGFKTEDTYYLGLKQNPNFFPQVKEISDGVGGAAIELEKSMALEVNGADGWMDNFASINWS